MGDLERYRERRDPRRTPEPFGGEPAPAPRGPGAPRVFVVQQHAARSTHWDLRLEIGGVLASWAVPKGPSLDPHERRLAVRTEDHPLEYADFEGVIPPGNYGAGAMIVWDRGLYRSADGRPPDQGLDQGKLDLLLEGHKLRGRFALVRTRGADGRQWLLLRKGVPPADGDEVVDTLPASVLSGLTVDELAAGATRDEALATRLAAWSARERLRAPVRDLDVQALRPMLAATADAPFSRPGWLFELKYDGVRLLARRGEGASVALLARSGGDRTRVWPELVRALAHLPLSRFVLDGEVIALDETGRASFERLQRRFTQSEPEAVARARAEVPVVLYAFDLLSALGRDLRSLPLSRRKELLSLFVPRLGVVRFADHVEGDGRALFEAARAHGLEGVVAKRADSRYESGRRSRAWQKIKVPRSALLAIVGLLPGRGSRSRLGSLMLGWRRPGEGDALHYAGSAGSGLSEAVIDDLLPRLEAARRERPAFRGVPQPPPRGAVFVEPRLVCEVRFTEVTSAGLLRHPVFLGVREDRDLADCVAPPELARAEADVEPPPPPETPPAARRPALQLTRLDKVFWPVEGHTKGDLLAYYERVWAWLAPWLRDRPVVLTRYPDGVEGKHFFQKNAPEFTPDWVRRETLDGTDYFVCNDLETLLYVVNSGAIPLHVGSARLGSLDHPDWLVLDLDPKQAPFVRVVDVARALHRRLARTGAPHYVKTSGQDGLHVLVPLGGRLDHHEARLLAEALARAVAAELPEAATVVRPVAARGRRVYVDFLQNGRGKLIAAPFSVRPRPGAPVSMPLTWRQVTRRLDPARFTIVTAVRELRRRGDPLRAMIEQVERGEGADVEALLADLVDRADGSAPRAEES